MLRHSHFSVQINFWLPLTSCSRSARRAIDEKEKKIVNIRNQNKIFFRCMWDVWESLKNLKFPNFLTLHKPENNAQFSTTHLIIVPRIQLHIFCIFSSYQHITEILILFFSSFAYSCKNHCIIPDCVGCGELVLSSTNDKETDTRQQIHKSKKSSSEATGTESSQKWRPTNQQRAS